MTPAVRNKSTRLNIRANERQKETIIQAARLMNTTVSDFVMQRAYAEAREILADQTRFELPSPQWEAFCAALDAPPKDIPELRKLLNESSVFDG